MPPRHDAGIYEHRIPSWPGHGSPIGTNPIDSIRFFGHVPRVIRPLLFLSLSLALLGATASAKEKPAHPDYQLREGDIVFQGNPGLQSDAVRAATDSPYTHCGVVVETRDGLAVFEAIHPVRVTRLEDFIARSLPGTFHARRLNQALDPAWVDQARKWAEQQNGKPYDSLFAWSDDSMYCSELVWKLYRAGGVELCKPRPFREYRLDEPAVKTIIDQRYGGKANLPLDEPAVAPSDLAASSYLVEVPRK